MHWADSTSSRTLQLSTEGERGKELRGENEYRAGDTVLGNVIDKDSTRKRAVRTYKDPCSACASLTVSESLLLILQ